MNDVVVDFGMIEQALQSVYEVPDLFNCLQFGLLAEAIVLHDQMIVETDSSGPQDRAEIDGGPTVGAEMIGVLKDAGIVVNRTPPSPQVPVEDKFSEVRSHVLNSGRRVRVVEEDFDLVTMVVAQAGNVLESERRLDRPGFLLTAPQAAYDAYANVSADNSVCDLSGHYDSLAATLVGLRTRSTITPSKYATIPLPPIAYRIFARTKSLDTLIDSTIAVRDDFGDLRARMARLQAVLDDPTVTLRDKLREKARWERRWRRMHDRYDQLGAANLALTNSAIYAAAPEIPGVIGLSPASWVKLMALILESVPELWSRWRLRAIHRSAQAYLKAPDSSLTDAIAKVRGREVGPEERNELSGLLDDLRRFSRTKRII